MAVNQFVLFFKADLSIIQLLPQLVNFVEELLPLTGVFPGLLFHLVSFIHIMIALNYPMLIDMYFNSF